MMWGAAIYNLQLFLCKYVFLERQRGTLPIIRLKLVFKSHIHTTISCMCTCIVLALPSVLGAYGPGAT